MEANSAPGNGVRKLWLSSNRFRRALLGTVCICLAPPAVESAVIYVRVDQTNNPPDGASWSTAFPAVQPALDVASDGDQIWVAAGAYFENIAITNGVALYGGFVGTESALGQRDWTNYLSILDGRQSNSVVRVTSPTNTTRLDGFVVRNGKASCGGGVNSTNASPTIINNRIVRNEAGWGGGIYLYTGAPVVASNLVQANVATNFGGGIYCYGSSVKIQNNRIMATSLWEIPPGLPESTLRTAGACMSAFQRVPFPS
jgi:hypothetical protein